MNTKPSVAIVCGPTASGKTDFSIRLARKLGSEVICADSRQVYREMSIGTARPGKDEMMGIKHHLCGSHSIHNTFDAAKFEQEALKLCIELLREQKTPVVCGGTGLYLSALCNGLDAMPGRNEALRSELAILNDQKGKDALKEYLLLLDPDAGDAVDLQNPQRVIRAIELVKYSKKPLKQIKSKKGSPRPFECVFIGMDVPRELLYKRIEFRVDEMIKQGLEHEVKDLMPFRSLEALNTVGYKELFDFFDEQITREEAINQIKQNSRHYAKRQLTWLRNQAKVHWINPSMPDAIEQALRLIAD